MKVGILTYHFSDNYGAVFQAYALRRWFELNGHEACFVNYQPDYVEAGGGFSLSRPFSKSNLKILFLKLMTFKELMLGDPAQKEGFMAFRRDFLGASGKVLKTKSDVDKSTQKFDMYVCGSDQIWKPSEHYGVDPVYFLDILGSQGRRIAYAPSFGTDSLDVLYQDEIRNLIEKLDGVSVREESGCSIVERLIKVRPKCVPDPTFLIDDYSQVMKPYDKSAGKHVFCYALRSRVGIGDVAEGIAAELGANLYSPHNPHRRWREIGETVYPCPSQWLYLLNSSEYVVTNSFHGTALSILLNKPFVVVGLQGGKEEFNARVLNLLEQVGLRDRFIADPEGVLIADILAMPIDWIVIDRRIKELRSQGVGYLENQISLVENFNAN
jgi:hypothetical protein